MFYLLFNFYYVVTIEYEIHDYEQFKANKLLLAFIKRFYYNLSKFIINPKYNIFRSTWYSNPFTRGTYTFDGLVVHEYPNARAILGKPLVDAEGNPKVLFAGEATDVIHFATVHGASDSGHREAIRILNSSKI